MDDQHAFLRPTPWDARVFGIDTYEILEYSEESLEAVKGMPGHFTIKVDPLADKRLLQEHGFYYCDTLIEPFATPAMFVPHENGEIALGTAFPRDALLDLVDGAFVYGRFHRDFALDPRQADLRYRNWLRQLEEKGTVWALLHRGGLAGFFACEGPRIQLHALRESYRGKGLAKYFWSRAIEELFAQGHEEVTSSVSAANLAVVNLYASLGFRFRRAVDVYHKLQGHRQG
jgi:GNAT superfamily N-acetyltransferase